MSSWPLQKLTGGLRVASPLRPRLPACEPTSRGMRSSCVVLTALVALAAYYIYVPLPSSVSDPWKLMLLDATFRVAQQVVRRSPALILSLPPLKRCLKGKRNFRTVSPENAHFSNAVRRLLFRVVQPGIPRVSHSPPCPQPRARSVSSSALVTEKVKCRYRI